SRTNVAYPHSCSVRAQMASTAPFPPQPCAITIAGKGPLPAGKPRSPESTTRAPGTNPGPTGERGGVPAPRNQMFPESVASREVLRSFAAGAHAAVPRVTSVENRSHLFTGTHSIQSAPMDLPKTASAVVIGGGVVGCSIAYNLARRGQRDVVV